ncbi:hypothetical protein [Corynebacterium ammoniagenes]|jgi:hypothetical protein|uniref:Uncharacterized protein n=2 Tax=Corynebacterium ammoniagenes TaxID=1697 RepID=A0AAV5G638_CORAM|nr:hypothetical protein [Corynebacterium ammoniagenes]APT82635.1 hypothetical protein CAMM_06780 [Corynebacterium ammoniagenes DSM 20306]AQS73701.1 hypothetical protein CA40472_07105 [Corynebacterium ammoniagenes]EFG82368.1 hypothetical protein HMPREF0281_00398 [Corynebacterium ammoniagenes DSM 20306]NMF30753.1 iron-containing alcohol dehydrogenase [Corynebacterium ammoniagenes]GJN42471.1 hypothetical protein CAT723_09500 [Corynebacterium ammoniagenes]
MSIRATYQPQIDEFMSNLESFATGDYLNEDEKEFWDQPFDPKALPALRTILERLFASFDDIPDDPTGAQLKSAVTPFFEELEAFNRKNHDAIIEPEEKQELNELIAQAAADTGADDEALNELPELD